MVIRNAKKIKKVYVEKYVIFRKTTKVTGENLSTTCKDFQKSYSKKYIKILSSLFLGKHS